MSPRRPPVVAPKPVAAPKKPAVKKPAVKKSPTPAPPAVTPTLPSPDPDELAASPEEPQVERITINDPFTGPRVAHVIVIDEDTDAGTVRFAELPISTFPADALTRD